MVEKLGIDESKIENLGNLQVIRYVRLSTTSSICFLSLIYGEFMRSSFYSLEKINYVALTFDKSMFLLRKSNISGWPEDRPLHSGCK
jgi:hypothetical protein